MRELVGIFGWCCPTAQNLGFLEGVKRVISRWAQRECWHPFGMRDMILRSHPLVSLRSTNGYWFTNPSVCAGTFAPGENPFGMYGLRWYSSGSEFNYGLPYTKFINVDHLCEAVVCPC